MQSSKNNASSKTGIMVFGALSALLLVVKGIIGSTEMPVNFFGSTEMPENFFRPFLIGLKNIGLLIFGDLITVLNNWYADWFLAPIVVLILQCVPFVGLALSICFRFGLLRPWTLPGRQKQAAGSFVRRDQPASMPETPVTNAIDTGVSRSVTELAMERLNRLQAQCGDRNPFKIPCAIRVQYLDDVSENNDYILRLEPGKLAVIPVSGKAEVHLKIVRGMPHIVGVERLEEHGKPVCREDDWCMKQNEPLILYRQGSTKYVKRIAITWLGDGNS